MNNDCAIEFYQKFGFEIVETREQYYKRIEPAGAHVLEKNLRKTAAGPNANADLHATNSLSNGNGTESQQSKPTNKASP